MLVSFWMTQRLTREINTLEKQLIDKQIELSNHQKYAGVLGGSSILTLGNIAGLSPDLLPRASLFAHYSDQASSMSAMQNIQMLKMTGRMPWLNNPMIQAQYEMSAFQKFKEQAMKSLKEQEASVLNEREKEIQLELNSIQQQLKMKQAQLDSYKQHAASEASKMAPDFG